MCTSTKFQHEARTCLAHECTSADQATALQLQKDKCATCTLTSSPTLSLAEPFFFSLYAFRYLPLLAALRHTRIFHVHANLGQGAAHIGRCGCFGACALKNCEVESFSLFSGLSLLASHSVKMFTFGTLIHSHVALVPSQYISRFLQ